MMSREERAARNQTIARDINEGIEQAHTQAGASVKGASMSGCCASAA